ncbi:PAAR domain-containing protein [Phyllobacterium phragmitis]
MPRIARVGDSVICKRGASTIIGGSQHRCEGKQIARVGDATGCGCTISQGSGHVKCGGQAVARQGDALSCGGSIVQAASKVDAH